MTHVTESDFQYSSARHLTEYIDRKEEFQLENSAGLEMSDEEKEMFIKKSEYRDFERHMVISPENNDMTDQELGEATRDSITEYFDGETVDFAYSVHRDTDSLHSHVALTGEVDDLYMNQSDLREFNELSEGITLDRERTLEADIALENDLDRERDRIQSQGTPDRDLDRDSDRTISSDGPLATELIEENELDGDREHSQGLDHDTDQGLSR